MKKFLTTTLGLLLFSASTGGFASASGTAIVRQRDGSEKTYTHVAVRLAREELALTTSDGQGTLVVGKAACQKEGALIKCLPYDATLFQNGQTKRISLKSGTVWLNPTTLKQPVPGSTSQLQGHGVLISATSKAGTNFTLNGTVDEIQK